ncbi:MAG: FAD-dependent oxidoreductase [Oscillospiraceae bacterium]|nr:FAD-dependent oxidoreductase [Oscillospiraceae bacterium]
MSFSKFGAWAIKPADIPAEKITERLTADVVVIGAGMSGVSCALRSAQCGLSVTVLEKSTSWSARGGNIGVVNSSFMKSHGHENDPAEVAREWIKRCGNRCNEKILWRYINESPRAMDWLIDIITQPEYGARPALQGSMYTGISYGEIYGSHRFFDGPMAKKGMRPGGADAVFAMYSEALKLGVDFRFSMPAVQLNKTGDRVTGVVAGDEDNYIEAEAKLGVVIATGDIGGNTDMCEDLAPLANKCHNKLYWPKGGNTGDGHRLGLWAGGSFEDLPFPTMLHPQAYHFRNYCFLFVKPDGTRFMNEDSYAQGKTVAILREDLDYAWSIMDGNWREQVPKTLEYGGGLFWGGDCEDGESEFKLDEEEKMLEFGLKRGVVVEADTIEELAEKMEVPVDVFTAEVKRYNENVELGCDRDFGKRRELLMKLDTPPFYGMKFGPALLAVVGGLAVDENMRVLSKDNTVVEGLFAIGNAAGGRYGVDYPLLIPGNSHGTALTFGLLTGEYLAGQSGKQS